jgi:ABC-2 type transport system permease protein
VTEGIVYDRGYQPHDGPRLGRSAAIRATIADGLRRVLGLRRKARKKVFPWVLLGIALIPAIVFVGLSFSLGEFNPDADSPFGGHPEYFNLAGTMVMIFAALAGPELLIPDRVEGVLAVYSSRPMLARDYLLAKGAALVGVVGFFLLVPQLLMYVGFAALDTDGFISAAIGNAGDLLRILLAAAIYAVAYGAPALLVAVFAKRAAPASAVYMGVMIPLNIVAHGIAEAAGNGFLRFAALGALFEHPHVVRDWIFDRTPDGLIGADVGLHPWTSLAVVLTIAAATGYVASRRYRREM